MSLYGGTPAADVAIRGYPVSGFPGSPGNPAAAPNVHPRAAASRQPRLVAVTVTVLGLSVLSMQRARKSRQGEPWRHAVTGCYRLLSAGVAPAHAGESEGTARRWWRLWWRGLRLWWRLWRWLRVILCADGRLFDQCCTFCFRDWSQAAVWQADTINANGRRCPVILQGGDKCPADAHGCYL